MVACLSRPRRNGGDPPDAGARASARSSGCITIFPWREGTGAVPLGEVSQCNDDNMDNRFNPSVGRFHGSKRTRPLPSALQRIIPLQRNEIRKGFRFSGSLFCLHGQLYSSPIQP
ncbi:MAG: D-lyxose/D-mannose family sugar isomerase [Oscillospiraceae bacterium]